MKKVIKETIHPELHLPYKKDVFFSDTKGEGCKKEYLHLFTDKKGLPWYVRIKERIAMYAHMSSKEQPLNFIDRTIENFNKKD